MTRRKRRHEQLRCTSVSYDYKGVEFDITLNPDCDAWMVYPTGKHTPFSLSEDLSCILPEYSRDKITKNAVEIIDKWYANRFKQAETAK